MEKTQISLLIFAVLSLLSAVTWIYYLADPASVFIRRIDIVMNGAWVVGDVLVIVTIVAGGVHLFHRFTD